MVPILGLQATATHITTSLGIEGERGLAKIWVWTGPRKRSKCKGYLVTWEMVILLKSKQELVELEGITLVAIQGSSIEALSMIIVEGLFKSLKTLVMLRH
jgi:hypothetical protein